MLALQALAVHLEDAAASVGIPPTDDVALPSELAQVSEAPGNVVVYGPTGSGKTPVGARLARCYMPHAIGADGSLSLHWVSWAGLDLQIRSGRYETSAKPERARVLRMIEAAVLFIDDVFDGPEGQNRLFAVVSARLEAERPTVLITSLPYGTLEQWLGARLKSFTTYHASKRGPEDAPEIRRRGERPDAKRRLRGMLHRLVGRLPL